jgi:CspA family cold shock protein
MSTVSSSNSETEKSSSSQSRITGRVKWFNNKVGFGFITACDGELKDKDVFVHYSAINVQDDQYKYLVQGEYVDFELSDSVKGEHEFHASKISGVKGGSLMCETRRLTMESHPQKTRVYKTPDDVDSYSPKPVRVSEQPRKKNADRPLNRVVNSHGNERPPVRRSKPNTK